MTGSDRAARFRYRYVPYGTRFSGARTLRSDHSTDQPPANVLCANEIAADVGGECRASVAEGHDGWRIVLDHHFFRRGQFPSAAAAVLHHAAPLHAWAESVNRGVDPQPMWLVTHQAPDFDGLCALYLIRGIVTGRVPAAGWERFAISPGAWESVGDERIDWFDPHLDGARLSTYGSDDDLRYALPILLAAAASRVDQCRTIRAPRTRALHSVLYAGFARGRDWEADGAVQFFDFVAEAMRQQHLNPLLDDVFVEPGSLAPELEWLDGEERRYLRDVGKARTAIVSVPVAPFEDWYPDVSATPLLTTTGEINPRHLLVHGERKVAQFDGVYVRDPECLLFKEWARLDREHASLHQGFGFTAIAYSNERLGSGSENSTAYYFSLDPERAGNAHLYPLWVRLQAAEMHASGELDPPQSRAAFESRRVGLDPWFDGHNFRATLIATPNSGTRIETRRSESPDLSDDRVAQIVMRELEYGVFGGLGKETGADTRVSIWDYHVRTPPTDLKRHPLIGLDVRPQSVAVSHAAAHPARARSLRFAAVLLRDVDLSSEPVGLQVGRSLWPLLERSGVETLPSDFRERHLIRHPDYVAVWNRNGVAIGYTACARSVAVQLRRNVQRLAAILRGLHLRLNPGASKTVGERLEHGTKLSRAILGLTMRAAHPAMLPIRRLLEAKRLDTVVNALQALDQEEFHQEERRRERAQKQRDDRLQLALAVVACTGLLFAWNQVESLTLANVFAWEQGAFARAVLGGLIAIGAVLIPFLILRQVQSGGGPE